MASGEQRRAMIADCLRRRKIRLKKLHLCQDCGSAPPKEGRTLCVGCLEDRRAGHKARSAQEAKNAEEFYEESENARKEHEAMQRLEIEAEKALDKQ